MTDVKRDRLVHISFLQFIGPIFVILGHSLNGIKCDNFWYVFSKEWIYIFHMPLFFFISGYLFSWKISNGERLEYAKLMKSKFKRLLIPYLFWNLIFLVPKYALMPFVSETFSLDLGYLVHIFIHPRQNVCGHTWFLAALFLTFSISPMWYALSVKLNKAVWVIVTIVFAMLSITPFSSEFLCISDLHKDLLFFWIGIMLGTVPRVKQQHFFGKNGVFAVFVGLAAIMSYIYLFISKASIIGMLTCTAIIISLYAAAWKFCGINIALIDKLAGKSFGIYILHWPAMLSVRIVLYQILELNKLVVVLAVIIAGYIIPVVILRLVERIKNQPIRRISKNVLGI